MAQNRVSGSNIYGKTKQSSDVADTDNIVEDSDTNEVSQSIESQPSTMSFLGGKARGKLGVLVLGVLLIVYLIYHFLINTVH